MTGRDDLSKGANGIEHEKSTLGERGQDDKALQPPPALADAEAGLGGDSPRSRMG